MIIFLTTFFVLLGSVPSVYLVTKFYSVEYAGVHIVLSIVLPMLLTPPVIFTFIKLSKHLKYFRDELEKEIEKNKNKDLILFEQARFVLMGEMMANISHQWKQPLNTIGLCIVDAKFSNNDNLEKNFNIIEDNVNYLATTIDDFMSFFDKKTHSEIRELGSIIQEIKSIIELQITNKEIILDIKTDKVCGEVKIASSISQVILNLLNNAKDAFDKNTRDKKIILKFITTDDSLKISCCDNGNGISLEIKDKIFDPYFTTKNKSLGTGIGLYMSKQIVQKVFNGNMTLNTEPVCFHINIPYSDKCILN